MATKKGNKTWTQQQMAKLTNRMTGASRGKTSNIAPGKQRGEVFNQGNKGYVDAYNLRNGVNTNKATLRALAEASIGRELTKNEIKKLRVRELKSGNTTEVTRPVDPRTGYRLNLKKEMTAFRITFS